MINTLKALLNFILHIDKNLLMIIHQYGTASYLFLFVIIFMETGLVVTPFLPGDSLLFAAGSISSTGEFNLLLVMIVCIIAAFVGDTVNYWIGRSVGPKIFESNNPFFKKAYLEKAQSFYKKHGGFAIILSRFVPIVRTFAPCVAGISKMSYPTFLLYNIIGGTLWVLLFTSLGFFFGNIPLVKSHFELVMVAIVLVSVVPLVIEFIKGRRESSTQA